MRFKLLFGKPGSNDQLELDPELVNTFSIENAKRMKLKTDYDKEESAALNLLRSYYDDYVTFEVYDTERDTTLTRGEARVDNIKLKEVSQNGDSLNLKHVSLTFILVGRQNDAVEEKYSS